MGAPGIDEKSHFLPETAERREALREDLIARADRLARRGEIAHAVGTADAALLDHIEQLGFTKETVRVLDLLPLVHVAWSDGRVQREERAAILSIVESRGIPPGSEACLMMEALLEKRPSESFLSQALLLVRELAARTGAQTADLVDLCLRVAEASGGLLGIGRRVSDEERHLLQRVAEALGDEAVQRLSERPIR